MLLKTLRSAASVLLASAALAACSHRATAAYGPPHVLRIAYSGDPNSLVPLVAIDSETSALDTLFCQPLTRPLCRQ